MMTYTSVVQQCQICMNASRVRKKVPMCLSQSTCHFFNCFKNYFIYAVPCIFCRFYMNIYKLLHIFYTKVIFLMILIQEITAFSADIRETLAPHTPSFPWPCVEESLLSSFLRVTKCRYSLIVISTKWCVRSHEFWAHLDLLLASQHHYVT